MFTNLCLQHKKNKKMKNLNYIFLLVITLFIYSCGGSSENSSSTSSLSGDIKIDGSSTVYPVTEAVAEEFRKVHPKVRVTCNKRKYSKMLSYK